MCCSVHAVMHIRRSEANLWELALSFHCAVRLRMELRSPDLAAGALGS